MVLPEADEVGMGTEAEKLSTSICSSLDLQQGQLSTPKKSERTLYVDFPLDSIKILEYHCEGDDRDDVGRKLLLILLHGHVVKTASRYV